MGLRAYLMVNVTDDMDQDEFISEMKSLEEIPGVDFVDTVIGSHDLVVMIDAPVTVEAIASKIQARKWVKKVEVLRIVSPLGRHRASRKELMKSLGNSGF